MSPRLATDDAIYGRLAYSVSASKNWNAVGAATNGDYCRLRQLWRGGASTAAPLLPHVRHVLLMSTKKEMAWTDAVSHVAPVANERPYRDGPVGNHPRNPMNGLVAALRKDHPISLHSDGSAPGPTPYAATDACPEALFNWTRALACSNVRNLHGFQSIARWWVIQ